MNIKIREFTNNDISEMINIWNEIVDEGNAFPQMEHLDEECGLEFFNSQSYTGVAYEENSGNIVGLYILHPNNIGRCGHISNASYAVKKNERGKKIGELLVTHCIDKAKQIGFKIIQFNAVVSSNTVAIKLYKKLGFIQLGIIPKGFLMKDGSYQDIVLFYLPLS